MRISKSEPLMNLYFTDVIVFTDVVKIYIGVKNYE